MTEKILGFKENNALGHITGIDKITNFRVVNDSDLVPVVSVEEHKEAIMYWHDKWIKMVEANEKLREKLKKEVCKKDE